MANDLGMGSFLTDLKKIIMNKIFKVADIRKLEQQVAKGDISYSRMVEIMNEMANSAESKVEKLPIPVVMPRSIPENLIIKGGVHTLRIDVYENYRGTPTCRITCIDDNSCTQDLDGEWIDEIEEGTYYLNTDNIDIVINKLQEVEKYLNGA